MFELQLEKRINEIVTVIENNRGRVGPFHDVIIPFSCSSETLLLISDLTSVLQCVRRGVFAGRRLLLLPFVVGKSGDDFLEIVGIDIFLESFHCEFLLFCDRIDHVTCEVKVRTLPVHHQLRICLSRITFLQHCSVASSVMDLWRWQMRL